MTFLYHRNFFRCKSYISQPFYFLPLCNALRQNIGHMFYLNPRILLVEAAAYLHHAGRAGYGYSIGSSICDILQFIMEDGLGDFTVLDAEGTGHAAAAVAVFHLHEVRAGHFDEFPGLFPNA